MSRGSSATKTGSVQNAKKRMQKFLRKLDRVPIEILQEEVPILKGEILAEIPYDTGTLESSVKVRVTKDKKRPGINVSASARSKDGYNYAGIQHENADYNHPKEGAKDHYLSDPLERCVERVQEKMRERLKP